MNKTVIRIEHVSKEYRLGAIGGGTLKGDLQTWMARMRGREDPNSKIGSTRNAGAGERFLAGEEEHAAPAVLVRLAAGRAADVAAVADHGRDVPEPVDIHARAFAYN